MSKYCIHCGAPLHEQASFCHVCATDQLKKKEFSPAKRSKYTLLNPTLAAVPLALLSVAAVIALVLVLRHSDGGSSVLGGASLPPARSVFFPSSVQISYSEETTPNSDNSSSVATPPDQPDPPTLPSNPGPVDVISTKAYADYEDSSGSYRFTLSFNLHQTETKLQPYTDVFLYSDSADSYAYTSQLYVHCMENGTILTPDFSDKIESFQVYKTDSFGRHRVSPKEGLDPYALQAADIAASSDVATVIWTILMKNGDSIQLSHRLIPLQTLRPTVSYTEYTLDTIDDLQNMIYALNTAYPPGTIYPPGSSSKVSLKITLPPVVYEPKPLHLENNKYSITGSNSFDSDLITTFTAPIDQVQSSLSSFRTVCFQGSGSGLALDFPYRVNCYNCIFDGWDAALRTASAGALLEGCVFKNLKLGVILEEHRYYDPTSASAQVNVTGCQFDRVEEIMLLQSPNFPRTVTFKSCSFSESGTPPSSVEQITVIVE